MNTENREKKIIRTGAVVIAANLMLAGVKLLLGLLSHSIAIVLDAVNNASDVLSSAVTIIGTKLAGRPADREHPMGHGRVEYISAQIVSAVILYAGVSALSESVKKLVNPAEPEYSTVTLVMLTVGVGVKLALGVYAGKRGRELNSDSLVNSASDALLDAVITASTLAAAVIYIVWGVSLEAWLGVVISLVIIKAGIGMFRATASKLMGERIDSELSRAIKETICSEEGVLGAYDLLLNSYGPDRWIGSVNIEVPDTWTADVIDKTCRRVHERIENEYGVVLSSVGIYSRNSEDDETWRMRKSVTEAVMSRDHVLQIHGFYCDPQAKTLRFDVVTDFRADEGEIQRSITDELRSMYPEYRVNIHMDSDYSD